MGWDLGDYYRDRMTMRELLVRIKALPQDSPLALALGEDRVANEATAMSDDIEAAINKLRGGA